MQRGGLDTGLKLVSGSDRDGVASPGREKSLSGRDLGTEVNVRPECRGLFPHMDGWMYVCEFEDHQSKCSRRSEESSG